MKREPRLLLRKALDSLVLAVEHFNRPFDCGRRDAVLILLDHSFEMLLKAAIVHRGGRIRERRAKETIGFDACLRRAFSDGKLRFLEDNDVLALQTLNGLRDAAHHHLLDMSEQHLYLQAQAAVTLFRSILSTVFDRELASELPVRVLPIATEAPGDLVAMFDAEMDAVRRLLRPGARRQVEAQAKMRALAIFEGAVNGERLQPDDKDLAGLTGRLRAGARWQDLFPGVASLELTTRGFGPSLDLRLTKKAGIPVELVPEGTPGAGVVALKRVDELGYYNLGFRPLAKHLGIKEPMLTALSRYLRLEEDPEAFKLVVIGKSTFKRYSQKAVQVLQRAISAGNLPEIWRENRPRPRRRGS